MTSFKNELQEYSQKNNLPLPIYTVERLPSQDHIPIWIAIVTFYTEHGKKFRSKGTESQKKIVTEQNAAEKALKYIKSTNGHINDKFIPLSNKSSLSNPNKVSPDYSTNKVSPDYSTNKVSPDYSTNKVSPDYSTNKVSSDYGTNKVSSDYGTNKVSPDYSTNKPKNPLEKHKNNQENNKVLIIIDVENVPSSLEQLLSSITKSKNIDIVCMISEDHHTKNKLNLSDKRVKLMEAPTTRKDGADMGIVLYIGYLLAKERYRCYIIISKDHFADATIDCIKNFDEMSKTSGFQRDAYACRTIDKAISILRKY